MSCWTIGQAMVRSASARACLLLLLLACAVAGVAVVAAPLVAVDEGTTPPLNLLRPTARPSDAPSSLWHAVEPSRASLFHSVAPSTAAQDPRPGTESRGATITPQRKSPGRSRGKGPWEERVLVLSNLDGDILRFKALLVLSGVAELVPDPHAAATQTEVDGVAETEEQVPGLNISENNSMAAQGADAKTAENGGVGVEKDPSTRPEETPSPAVRFVASAREGESAKEAQRRAALLERQQGKLAHLATGRLHLTDACSNTIVVLLGNSVGTYPHSHEIIDAFATLRREGMETRVNCQFHFMAGPHEMSFLAGDFGHLTTTASTAQCLAQGKDDGSKPAAPFTSVAEMHRRQRQRRVLSAFSDDLQQLKDVYSPYGAYGRFLLNNNLFVLRLGDTVLSHGSVTAAYARLGVRATNAELLDKFKSRYTEAGGYATPADGDRSQHVGHHDAQPPPPYLHATTKMVNETSAAKCEADPLAFLRGSPLSDQSLVLAAALVGNCTPVREALQLLSLAEGHPVRRVVVAGDTSTTAIVKARYPTSISPLAAPVSQLCGGALVVVAGGERPDEPLAFLTLARYHMQHTDGNGDAAAGAVAADVSVFRVQGRYPVGTRAVPLFAYRRQPVAPPQWARAVRTADPEQADGLLLGDDGEDADDERDAARLARQLNWYPAAAADNAAAERTDERAEPQPRELAPVLDGQAGKAGHVATPAAEPPVPHAVAKGKPAAAAEDTLRRRVKQQRRRHRTDGKSVWRHLLTKAKWLLFLLAVVVCLCAVTARASPHVRVSFLRLLHQHDKSH